MRLHGETFHGGVWACRATLLPFRGNESLEEDMTGVGLGQSVSWLVPASDSSSGKAEGYG